MTLQEKYPNVFKALELWSAEWKTLLKEKFENGKLANFEYVAIMARLCLQSKEEVDEWLMED